MWDSLERRKRREKGKSKLYYNLEKKKGKKTNVTLVIKEDPHEK